VELGVLPEAAGAVVVTVAVAVGVVDWLPEDAQPAAVATQANAAAATVSRPDTESPGLESRFLEYPAWECLAPGNTAVPFIRSAQRS